MKLALTVWEERISPVFDAATTLLLVDIENGAIKDRRFVSFDPQSASRLVEMLEQMAVSTLVCGAISEGHENRITAGGIKLVPFVSGRTERILAALASGRPIIPAFSMPGCGRRHRSGSARYPYFTTSKEVMDMPKGDGTGPLGQGPGSGRNTGRCKTRTGTAAGKCKGAGRGRGRRSESGGGKSENVKSENKD